jgi:TonB-linked SusC/RagA family outer membrane protein
VGTNEGTSTDANGNYAITAAPNASLAFSFIGFVSQTVAVNNRTIINVQLADDSQSLSDVVVTALGIERSAKSLSYATTNISAEDLNEVKGPSVLNSLAGKAAGVFVTQGSGGPGSSPRIVLRGNKSITGGNSPLYVVDGIPVGGFADYNAEDIESLQVLQGASAAALYGSQAANGVILITTKKGKYGATSVNFSSTATFDSPMLLPEIQTTYGQGKGGVTNTTINDSWGPKITNGTDSHIANFFRTGQNYINSISVSSGTEKSRVYLSYANTDAKSMLPNYDFQRNNFTARGSVKVLEDKVTLDAGINFIKSNTQDANASSWYNSPMFGLYLFPPGDDINKYKPNGGGVWSEARGMYLQNWPYLLNQHSSNQNPYWIVNRIQNDNLRERTNFFGSAKWDVTDWLNVSGRVTLNKYGGDLEERFAAGTDPTNIGVNGGYNKNVTAGEELYTDFMIASNKPISEEVSLNIVAGARNTVSQNRGFRNGTDGALTTLIYPNFFSVSNLAGNFIKTESQTKEISRAVFGTATVGWNETVFLDGSVANEWSSTVDKSFFYPSIGLSYILTETIGASDFLSFVKLRGSYAEVGNSLPFGAAERFPNYSLATDGNVNGRANLPFFSGTDTISLNPERTRSIEFGAETRFFNNKLSLNVTYYRGTTRDQVFTITAPSGSGATNFWINGGTIQNQGIEASASYNARFGDLSWTPSVNFTRNTNKILMLSDLLTTDRFVLNSGNRLINLYLLRPGSELLKGRKYGAYHDLFGTVYQRDANGNQLFDENNLPLKTSTDDNYIGNANPDFLLNFNNNFKYKNFNLSFLLDGRFGGLVASSTEQWLDWKGISKRSAEARDAGGVKLSNGQVADPQSYYDRITAGADRTAVATEYVFKSTNVRFREVALGYTVPAFGNTFKSINVSLVARNLFFLYKKAPFDPELALGTGNGAQGFESFQLPSARSIGLTVRVGL